MQTVQRLGYLVRCTNDGAAHTKDGFPHHVLNRSLTKGQPEGAKRLSGERFDKLPSPLIISLRINFFALLLRLRLTVTTKDKHISETAHLASICRSPRLDVGNLTPDLFWRGRTGEVVVTIACGE